ncbi:hypothetical protein LWP59_35120 [Amycolatopsis acidiphila]|uniref:hypothetical protein n=1 Tax=Amycolatopsis acidiphila TaxID=715473 RepID=UPI0019C2B174|nr:hypothetical protein [Amycolatopsis acidiphila]UIJ59223.1 hypothetical protein LWP59_35120 [Amycolatopsis acidiphila]GHG79227.1 hypothetical protein GCM10017788_47120 [Amycolatopsis acidiphila]
MPRGVATAVPRLDWPGFLLIGAGLPLFVYAVTTFGEKPTLTAPTVAIPLFLGLAGIIAFGVRAWRREHALLDLRLFRDRVYAAAAASSAFIGASMFGAMLLFPLYFQLLRGADVVTTGLSLVSLGVGTMVALPFAGRLSDRLSDRLGGGVVAFGGAVFTVLTTLPFALLAVVLARHLAPREPSTPRSGG